MPNVVLLAPSGLGSDWPAMTPPSAQEPLDVGLTEFGRNQHHAEQANGRTPRRASP